MSRLQGEGSPLLELHDRSRVSPSPNRSATFNQDDPSSLENYRIPTEAPPPYSADAPEGPKPETVSGAQSPNPYATSGYTPSPYAAPQSQAPQTELPQTQPAQPWQWHQTQPQKHGFMAWVRRRKCLVGVLIMVIIGIILIAVLKTVLSRSSSSSDSGSGSNSSGPNYQIVPQTAMTFVGDDDNQQPGLLFFKSYDASYDNRPDVDMFFTDGAYYVVGGEADDLRNSWPLYKSGMGFAIGAAANIWTYYAASTDYDGALQVTSGTPSTDGFFDDITLSLTPTLSLWTNNSVAGMAMAAGSEYNNDTQQWDNGFSLVACAADGSVHEYTWAKNTSKLDDRFTWPETVKCNLPTMIRNGSSSFLMQRPDNTSDTVATWRRNDTGWEMGDKNFTVPHGNRYAACGEIFAFQDATGALKVASMTYPASGAASFGAVSTVAATGAPNGTSLACKWKSQDEMRVYYQDNAGLHYYEKKPGSPDWTQQSLTLNWDISSS